MVSERVVSERVLGDPFTRLVQDEETGAVTFLTYELVEKTIEQEVETIANPGCPPEAAGGGGLR